MSRPMPPAAILAGGLGTRIRSVGGDVPKVLLPVAGRPFLAHLLDALCVQGVTTGVLCLGHAADRVWDAARNACPRGMTLIDSREPQALGTGGALRLAREHLGTRCLVLNGDTWLDTDYGALVATHREQEAVFTLALVRSAAAAEKGSVVMDATGRVTAFAEKTREGTGLINAGVYVLDPVLLDPWPRGKAVSLEREIIPRALSAGAVVAGRVEPGPFVDIGLPDDYLGVRDALPKGAPS